MKLELAALDLHFLIGEFQELIGGKVEQIYLKGKEELVLSLHLPNVGKRILRILIGKLAYLARQKGEMPERPASFCVYLRKYLKNARIREIRQLGFERIMEISLETKTQRYNLIAELFSKGNVVLCDDSYNIFSTLDVQHWKDRTIKAKSVYDYPKKSFNFLKISQDELDEMCSSSEKESIVKTLAIDLGLGGEYSEEICRRAGIDKSRPAKDLSADDRRSLFSTIASIREGQPFPCVIGDRFASINVSDACVKKGSLNETLDELYTEESHEADKALLKKETEGRISKVQKMIDEQKQKIKGLEVSAKDNQRKGELIFENYQEIKDLLSRVKEAVKKHGWEAVKISGRIKAVDPKTGDMTIEVGD